MFYVLKLILKLILNKETNNVFIYKRDSFLSDFKCIITNKNSTEIYIF